jgi:hypothetical protein
VSDGLQLVSGHWYPHSFSAAALNELETFILGHDRTVTLAEVAAGDTDPAAIAVRHDVDHDAEHALRFARWEHDRGIRASYYLLPTARYYEPQIRSTAGVLAVVLQELGHEVGVHCDAYTSTKGDVERALELLRQWADELRAWGIDVHGCADHGGGAPANVDLWRSCRRTPAEASFEYEAYLLHGSSGANYVSDNRGTWRAPLEDVDGRQTHLLVHPCHWTLP